MLLFPIRVLSRTFDGECTEKCEILRFQGILVGELGTTGLGFRFTGQRRVVDFEALRLDDANIGRYTIAEFHFDDVAHDELLRFEISLLTIANSQSLLKTNTQLHGELISLDTLRTGGTLEQSVTVRWPF